VSCILAVLNETNHTENRFNGIMWNIFWKFKIPSNQRLPVLKVALSQNIGQYDFCEPLLADL